MAQGLEHAIAASEERSSQGPWFKSGLELAYAFVLLLREAAEAEVVDETRRGRIF